MIISTNFNKSGVALMLFVWFKFNKISTATVFNSDNWCCASSGSGPGSSPSTIFCLNNFLYKKKLKHFKDKWKQTNFSVSLWDNAA